MSCSPLPRFLDAPCPPVFLRVLVYDRKEGRVEWEDRVDCSSLSDLADFFECVRKYCHVRYDDLGPRYLIGFSLGADTRPVNELVLSVRTPSTDIPGAVREQSYRFAVYDDHDGIESLCSFIDSLYMMASLVASNDSFWAQFLVTFEAESRVDFY